MVDNIFYFSISVFHIRITKWPPKVKLNAWNNVFFVRIAMGISIYSELFHGDVCKTKIFKWDLSMLKLSLTMILGKTLLYELYSLHISDI